MGRIRHLGSEFEMNPLVGLYAHGKPVGGKVGVWRQVKHDHWRTLEFDGDLGGFLGQCLATSLLQKGSLPYDNVRGDDLKQQQQQQQQQRHEVPITKLVLVDIFFPPTLQPAIEDAIQNQSESTTIKVSKVQERHA